MSEHNREVIEIERPHCPDAERALIADVFLNPSLVSKFPPARRFYKYRLVAQAVTELAGQGIPPDAVRVVEHLRQKGELELVGGAAVVYGLDSGIPCHGEQGMAFNARMINRSYEQREAEAEFYDAVTRVQEGEPALEVAEVVYHEIRERASECGTEVAIAGCFSASELLSAEVCEPDEIFHAATRGQLGAIIAVTNIGKTTLMMNVAIALAAGETCLPLVPGSSPPRKVCYLDFESTAGELQRYLRDMLLQVSHRALVEANLVLCVDAMVGDEPLCLSNPSHFKKVEHWLLEQSPDLVIIDTASAAFSLTDENSNAEVTRKLMRPLRSLARTLSAAVWFSHHKGKSNEAQSAEKSYHGRGASAFGGLSRWVLNLERDPEKGDGYVVLSLSKCKGFRLEPVLLSLDRNSHWFQTCAGAPTVPRQLRPEDISEFVAARAGNDGEVKTSEITDHFAAFPKRTVETRLKTAKERGLVEAPKQGSYRPSQRTGRTENGFR